MKAIVYEALEKKRLAAHEMYLRNETIGEYVCPDCAGPLVVTKKPGFLERCSYCPRTEMKCTVCGLHHTYILPAIYGM